MTLYDQIIEKIEHLEERKTKHYRAIAKSFKKSISELLMSKVYTLCEKLLDHKTLIETIVAYQIIYDQRKRYDEETITIFEKWTFSYIRDWWDCDDFMTHAFFEAMMRYPEKLSMIKEWVEHQEFAVRRSAAVILIVPAKRGLIPKELIFEISNLLMQDEHYLVQKGYGWLLKEASIKYHDDVVKYLQEHVHKMTRTAFRYALEKLPKEEKEALMLL